MADFNDYTKIKGIKYFNWVKRIRQAHLSGPASVTLCGMPMLGNNYARDYEQQHWNRCEKCYNKAQSVKLDDAGKLKAIEQLIEEESHEAEYMGGYIEPELASFIARLALLLKGEPVKIPGHLPDAQTLCVEEEKEELS